MPDTRTQGFSSWCLQALYNRTHHLIMKGGFVHVFASGVFMLLATTTTMVVNPAAAYSPELTDSSVTVETEPPATSEDNFFSSCGEEYFGCQEDAACSSCREQDPDDSSATPCGFNPIITGEEDCATSLTFACCLDDLSDFECLDNEAFVELWMCVLDDIGCSADEITCDGAESTTEYDAAATTLGPASIALALSAAFMVLLPLLWV